MTKNTLWNREDRDLLVEIRTDIKYIKKGLNVNVKKIEWLNSENQARKDWQEDWNGKAKFLVGIATFVGGIIVFIGNKVWEVFVKKL